MSATSILAIPHSPQDSPKKKPTDEGKEGEDLVGRTGLHIGSPTLAHYKYIRFPLQQSRFF